MMLYLLPSHPSLTSLDPLGITDSDNPTIWKIITASIQSFRDNLFPLWELPQLIEDIAYSLHGTGHVDTRFLRQYLTETYQDLSSLASKTLLNEMLDATLDLPTLFPSSSIPYLTNLHPAIELSQAQIRSLVAHQILGTLNPPEGNDWGCTFICWYSEPQPLDHAVRGYLATVFHFFELQCTMLRPTMYELCVASVPLPLTESLIWTSCDTPAFDHLVIESTSASSVRFPHRSLRCMLVSSNKSPGFGPASTQEELVTGACPALLPFGALLVSPPVPDNAALLARGVVPMAAWEGQGRNARMIEKLKSETEYTFLLLDALELDALGDLETPVKLVDLIPDFLLRELHKAYGGFLALRTRGIRQIAAPLWGAGAFGGDPVVKTIILAMAGALAGVTVWLSVDNTRSLAARDRDAPLQLISVLTRLKEICEGMTVQDVWGYLTTEQARGCVNGRDLLNMLSDVPGS
jgi:poly(ADP-ribose) glycohydrolase